jgi:uncharacterized protein YbbK (DUF523 family)
MAKYLVSGCLLGCECRYKGDSCKNDAVLSLAKEHTLIAVCPEQMGGLPTPRDPAEIVGDRVMTANGADVTEEYTKGAEAALMLAKLNNVDAAILKANSPSCGSGVIYDGTFTGAKRKGDGVTSALLQKNGFSVYTEDELHMLGG